MVFHLRTSAAQNLRRSNGWSPQRPADRAEELVRSPGRSLDQPTRSTMERTFGYDFSHVKVHTDAAAAASAAGPLAYTVGHHVVFGAGQYAPGTPAGDRLIAHELTHVVQQRDLPGSPTALVHTSADHPSEREADSIGSLVMARTRAGVARVRPMQRLTGVLGVAQLQRPAQRPFGEERIEDVRSAYEENAQAAANDPNDRAACIVMLNVAVGRLLGMKTRPHPAKTKSTRMVDMPLLTTDTVEKAMAQLVKKGLAERPIRIRFLDTRGRTAGTLAPQTMEGSAQAEVLGRATGTGWYGFGLSILHGYHSVLLLVDATGDQPTIYWLDQFSTGIDDDVTDTLDDRLLTYTKKFWERFRAAHAATGGARSDTWARIWPLRGNVAP